MREQVDDAVRETMSAAWLNQDLQRREDASASPFKPTTPHDTVDEAVARVVVRATPGPIWTMPWRRPIWVLHNWPR